jgi:predicted MFS family arabinose efflux permease
MAGAFSSTLGMGALVYGIVRAADAGWGDALTLTSLAIGLVLIALFVFNQARAAQPILPLRLFASRQRSGAYAARMLFLGGMVGFWFFTTQFLQGVLGYRPLTAGLAFLPATLPNLIAALLVPRLTRRLGSARLVVAGLALGVVGLAWLGQASADTQYWTGVALPMLLIGASQGAVLAPLTAVAVADVASEDAGAASGLVNVAHQMGGSLGLAVMVVVFAAAEPAALAGPIVLAHRVAAAIDTGALMLLAALGVALATIHQTSVKTAHAASSPALVQRDDA